MGPSISKILIIFLLEDVLKGVFQLADIKTEEEAHYMDYYIPSRAFSPTLSMN